MTTLFTNEQVRRLEASRSSLPAALRQLQKYAGNAYANLPAMDHFSQNTAYTTPPDPITKQKKKRN